MDFVQGLDPSKLVLAETVWTWLLNALEFQTHRIISQVLSFLLSPFSSPPYNLAIFLFGIYAQENSESVQALQTVRRISSPSYLVSKPNLFHPVT